MVGNRLGQTARPGDDVEARHGAVEGGGPGPRMPEPAKQLGQLRAAYDGRHGTPTSCQLRGGRKVTARGCASTPNLPQVVNRQVRAAGCGQVVGLPPVVGLEEEDGRPARPALTSAVVRTVLGTELDSCRAGHDLDDSGNPVAWPHGARIESKHLAVEGNTPVDVGDADVPAHRGDDRERPGGYQDRFTRTLAGKTAAPSRVTFDSPARLISRSSGRLAR